MTPLTVNPTVLILMDHQGNVLKTATNIAPDLKIEITYRESVFNEESGNKPFVHEVNTRPENPVKGPFFTVKS